MVSYKVVFRPSVEKDLRSLPREVIARVFNRVEALKDDPFLRQSIKLAGAEQLYRLGIGDYRVIYGIDKEARQVMFITFGTAAMSIANCERLGQMS